MPCYLFTYHAYGSWLPDRKRGYVRRKVGVLATDTRMAECYRRNIKQEVVKFDGQMQQSVIESASEAFKHQSMRGHAIATDPTHVHLLVSWKTDRSWKVVRRCLRTSLTRQLNRQFETRSWFAKQPSRKRIEDREHFEYLIGSYLPRHRGWKWNEQDGMYR